MLRKISILVFIIALSLIQSQAHALNFIVSDLGDNGANTFRNAITLVNGNPGPHTIGFSVTGTINLTSALPIVTQAVSIDGDTNNDGVPDIILNGNAAGNGVDGLVISGGSSTVTGLVIENFTGIGLTLSVLGNDTVTGNYLGIGSDGQTSAANDHGELLIDDVANNQIGGTNAVDRNVIGGSNHQASCDLFVISGSNAIQNIVQGNYVGITADGETDSSNCENALIVTNDSTDNTIGGDVAGAGNILSGSLFGLHLDSNSDRNIVQGNLIGTDKDGNQAVANADLGILIQGADNQIGGITPLSRNVISGNNGDGILFGGGNLGARRNVIEGNFIGTDITGTVALPNDGEGISLQDSDHNTVGGLVPEARNIISGNTGSGISLPSSDDQLNLVQGNYIGVDVTGLVALPNAIGIKIDSQAHDNTIGGTAAGAANVISGNTNDGIQISASAGANNLIQGNFIGTNSAGTSSLPNGGQGILSNCPNANTIGGSDPGARNLISGNAGFGIQFTTASNSIIEGNFIGSDITGGKSVPNVAGLLLDNSTQNILRNNLISGNLKEGIQIVNGANGNQIFGNKIGTDLSGAQSLPNPFGGILVNSANNNLIGGDGAGEGNQIAFNGQEGVEIESGDGNRIWGNSIFENDLLGISLNGGLGNLGQPAPTLSAARISGMQLNVVGSLSAAPNANYTIQFFSNAALDPSGFGEGQVFLGEATTTTDGSGNVNFDLDVTMVVASNFSLITATATDPANNTSEFSNGATAIMVGSVQFSADIYQIDKDSGTAKVLVTRSGGSEGDVQVDFATSDLTCVAGTDYQAVSQTLDFPAGVTSVEVTIPVENNPNNESSCAVQLTLSNPQGGTTLSSPFEALLNILGSAPTPGGQISGGGCSLVSKGGEAPVALGLFALTSFGFALALRRKF